MKCGLLGRKLSHSYSPQIHAQLADYPYVLFEKEPDDLDAFLKSGEFTGINVTVPYKQAVIPHLDELTPLAEKLGAVNTIVRKNGKLIGHNTDYFGFRYMLSQLSVDLRDKKALVLGSGGASKTVCAVLQDLGCQAVIISRTGEDNYENVSGHADAALIVNTTPVGMYPDVGVSPLSLSGFPKLEGVLDVIYNPARTALLLEAEKLGIPAVNGLSMLVAQAKEAAEWFSGKTIPDECIPTIQAKLEQDMGNIVLIGMPGCGKSTVGQILSAKTGRPLVDSDAAIVARAGKFIPEIFAQDGEEVFRELETSVLEDLGKRSGLIIATGGGCVTKARNYPLLHQNGRIFWIQRDLNALATDGRPLSQTNSLEEMYQTRAPLYAAFADFCVENTTPDAAAAEILRILEGQR